MKLKTGSRAATVLVGGLGVALLGGTAAYAVWSTSGSGTGAAQARTFTAPTITAGTATAELYPGSGSIGDLVVQVTNPNPFQITVTLAEDLTKKIVSDKSNCAETVNGAHTVTGVSFSGGSFTVPANTNSAVTRTIVNSVAMSTASVTECQGAAFTIPVSTTSVSS